MIQDISVLRGFAILLVLLGHSILAYPINLETYSWCKLLHNYIYSFHMQLLFIISGYLYAIGSKKPYMQYIKGKFFRLLVPYFVFSLLVTLSRFLFSNFVNRQIDLPIVDIITNILLYAGQYWFLYVLFFIFAAFPLIENMLNRRLYKYAVIGAWIYLLLFPLDIETFAIPSIIYHGFFFFIGYSLVQKNINQITLWLNNKYVFFCMVLLFLLVCHIPEGTNVVASIICPFIGSALFYGIVLRLRNTLVINIVSMFGEYSLQLYLLDGFALALIRHVLINVFNIHDPSVLVVSIFLLKAFLLISVIKYSISKFAITRFIFGMKRNADNIQVSAYLSKDNIVTNTLNSNDSEESQTRA